MGVKKSQKWRNIIKSTIFYQIIWDPLQDAIFQKILILKHDFNYSYYPIEGFILIFYLCQTIKEYKSYQKVRFNLGDPVYLCYITYRFVHIVECGTCGRAAFQSKCVQGCTFLSVQVWSDIYYPHALHFKIFSAIKVW